jgi:hypothetical protein
MAGLCARCAGIALAVTLAPAVAVSPPAGGSIWSVQSAARDGSTDGGLDFDLDRFERPHVAFVEPGASSAATTRVAQLHYLRFDGMVWRDVTLATLQMPASGAEADGDGLLAIALTGLDQPRPAANVLFLDRGAPGPADDVLRLARDTGSGVTVELVRAGTVARGIQLSATPSGALHAAWLDPQAGVVRHALRAPGGGWTEAVVSLAGHVPGPPSAAVRSDGRYLLGYTSGAAIHLFDDAASAPGDATLAPIAAPTATATAAGIAVHFRSGGQLGVAWVGGTGRQELYYALGTAGGFEPAGFPRAVGVEYLLPFRNALPNQEDSTSVALVLAQNATETQVYPLSGFGDTDTSLQVGGFLRGLLLRGTRRHGIGYGQRTLRDVQWHRRGDAWTAATAATGGNLQPVSQAEDADGSPLVLLRDTATLQLARWSEPDNDFVREPIPSTLAPPVAHAAIAAAADGRTAIAFRDAGGALRLIERSGSGPWTPALLEATTDGGLDPRAAYADDGRLFVLHRRSGSADLLHLVVRDAAGTTAVGVAGPFASATLVPGDARLAVVGASGDAWISRFDAVAGTLVLVHRRPSGAIASQTLGAPGQVFGERHALRATAEGQPALAYTARPTSTTALSIRYRFLRGTQVIDEPVRFGQGFESVDDLQLALKNDSGDLARIAYLHQGFITGSRSVGFDVRRINVGEGAAQWGAQSFGALGGSAQRDRLALASVASDQVRVYEDGAGGGVRLYSRTQQFDDRSDASFTSIPPLQRFGSEFACRCPGNELPGQTPLTSCQLEVARRGPVPGAGQAQLFADLRARFDTTAGGRYYLGLWAEHGDEIARLALSDPTQMASRVRALGDFLPGLAAFVVGEGSAHRMDADMIAAAREVWIGWRDRGSPALRATVTAELARTNQLAQFQGMTFDEWFAALQPGTADGRLFSNGFE